MARPIATEQVVINAAEDIAKENREPSVQEIRDRVGGGSYTTIKQHLDNWRRSRAQAGLEVGTTPAEIEQKGLELARLVWSEASQRAQSEGLEAKRQAQVLVDTARKQLAEASVEIERLEQIESVQIAEIERLTSELRSSEVALAQANMLVSRTADLERRLENAHTDMKEVTRTLGQLSGENTTLRNQLRLMTAAKIRRKRP